jgi:ribonuclease BN (tRNA processing enzyme)
MLHLKVLGSCSGTEPMPNRHHTSIVLTVNGRNYFFDAGENCAHTAYINGIDMMSTRAIFISHVHFDHIGGLMGIFRTVEKLCIHYRLKLADSGIKLFITKPELWAHLSEALKSSEGLLKLHFDVTVEKSRIGRIYEDENVVITAFESHHIPPDANGDIQAFSFRILTEGKTIVFSGDVRDMDDLVGTVGDGCDVLLCETGHHKVETVCAFAESHNVKQLVFVHHGREILEDRPVVKETVEKCKIPVVISTDGMNIEI